MTTGQLPRLLIYTDASHSRDAGSWGAVVIGVGDVMEAGGAFRGPCPCSTTAEMQGVANALHLAAAAGKLTRTTDTVVLCDNQSVVELLNRTKGLDVARLQRRTPALWQALRHVREAVRDLRAPITFQWVKGHQSVATADEHRPHNNRADRLARDHHPYKEQRAIASRIRRAKHRASNAQHRAAQAAAAEAQPHGA